MKRSFSTIQSTNDEIKKFRPVVEGRKSVTRFEDLSNELFYELFDYLEGGDIFTAVSNLNVRFQTLLTDPSLLLKMKISSRSVIHTRCKSIVLPNRARILSLNFADESLLDRFLTHCTLDSSFPRLQSLNLNSLPVYKCVVLLFDLISLPHLSSLTCSLTSCFVDISYIYRIIFRLSHLIYLKLSLPMIEDLTDFEQTIFVAEKKQFSPIEHLILDHCCTLYDFMSIISFTPRLRRLTCQTLFETDVTMRREVLLTVPNLTHLVIDRCELEFNRFEALIERIASQLRVFHITIHSKNVLYLDADQWERLITQYMPHLKKLYFKYYEVYNDRSKLTPSHQRLDRFSSSFWLERQWIFGLEIDTKNLIYSIQPYRKPCSVHLKNGICFSNPFDIKYRCAAGWAESFHEYFSSIFPLLKIIYLDVDCNQVPLLVCIKLIGLLPDLKSLKLSSLSMTEAKRLSTEKWKTIHAVTYHNKITKVILDAMVDFGEIQFLTTLCPAVEYLQISPALGTDLVLLVEFILTKQNDDHITCLSTLCLHVQNGNNQMVSDLHQMIEEKQLLCHFTIKRIGHQIFLYWVRPNTLHLEPIY